MKKYNVKPPRDLRSKFELKQESKKEAEKQAEKEKQRKEEEERIAVWHHWFCLWFNASFYIHCTSIHTISLLYSLLYYRSFKKNQKFIHDQIWYTYLTGTGETSTGPLLWSSHPCLGVSIIRKEGGTRELFYWAIYRTVPSNGQLQLSGNRVRVEQC